MRLVFSITLHVKLFNSTLTEMRNANLESIPLQRGNCSFKAALHCISNSSVTHSSIPNREPSDENKMTLTETRTSLRLWNPANHKCRSRALREEFLPLFFWYCQSIVDNFSPRQGGNKTIHKVNSYHNIDPLLQPRAPQPYMPRLNLYF